MSNIYNKILNELARIFSLSDFILLWVHSFWYNNSNKKNVSLVLGDATNSLLMFKMFFLLILSYQLQGYKIKDIFYFQDRSRFSYSLLLYLLRNINLIKYDLSSNDNKYQDEIDKILSMNFAELRGYEVKNIRFGLSICNRLLRELKVTPPNKCNISDIPGSESIIRETIHVYHCLLDLTSDEVDVKLHGVFYERGYAPNGIIWEYLLEQNCPVWQWGLDPVTRKIITKLYDNKEYKSDHLFKITVQDLKKYTETKKENLTSINEITRNYITNIYLSNNAYNGQFINNYIKPHSVDIVRKMLNSDTRPIAIVFPHIFYDATLTYGTSLYESYKDWFIGIARCIKQNQRIKWIIKLHPAHSIKDDLENSHESFEELSVLEEVLGENYRELVELIYPKSEISAHSLMLIGDYALTVRGTAGIEAACFGLETIIAGTGRYDGLGFTTEFLDKFTFENYLINLPDINLKPANSENMACKAYQIMLSKNFTSCGCVKYIQRNGFMRRVSIGGFDMKIKYPIRDNILSIRELFFNKDDKQNSL